MREMARFVDRYGDLAAEVIWRGALALIGEAADDAGEGNGGRWQSVPRSELRRLRRDLAGALELAHLAVTMQEGRSDLDEELLADVRRRGDQAAARERRQQTREAERVRLLKHAARKAGRSLSRSELWPGMFAPGSDGADEVAWTP